MILIVFILVALAVALWCLKNAWLPGELATMPVCFNERCFNVEVASTLAARTKGLMYRQNLADDAGMLFVFGSEDVYPFWMKNTFIPLDIIWIGENKEVVYIAKNVQPCKTFICPSVSPARRAKYVLEINAGKADEAGLKVGDRLNFELRQ